MRDYGALYPSNFNWYSLGKSIYHKAIVLDLSVEIIHFYDTIFPILKEIIKKKVSMPFFFLQEII